MHHLWQQITRKEDPQRLQNHDAQLEAHMTTKDLLGLGLGMVVGTAIFTLPGIVAAEHTGPAVALSFIVGALGAGLAALAYAEMAATLPVAGSAFSWIGVLFGEGFGWIAGWLMLSEYFLAITFVASGWSAYVQGFLGEFGFHLPAFLSSGYNPKTGGVFDIFAALAIILVAILLTKRLRGVNRVENLLVVLKIAVVLLFVIVGITAIHPENYHPFLPAHKPGTSFGGVTGVMAGAAQIFVAYGGFDVIASNTAETKDPGKNMPRGILGTLLIGSSLFVAVSLVLVGMFSYQKYANNPEASAWALRQSGHLLTANLLAVVAIVGMFASLIGTQLASSRLVYAFGRDGMLPKRLGRINHNHLPINALLVVTIAAVVVGSMLPFTFLANLVSAGTLISFIFVALGIYALRPREGKDLPLPKFRMPFYPVLPGISVLVSLAIFLELSSDAKTLTAVWFVIGVVIYLLYGKKHSSNATETEPKELK
ncbi:Amino acid transporter [Fructilactobacillus florum 8D]|uniref:Amino acid transporter n=2 Tax=Fructilactobacillus florum TaxID=640331 RepID=W9EHN1_9LACO|nr:amino acid permease [Fructilactobacillus florum]ETO40490.1 Amino acid transporter [Fructilactobacillus florum 8D]KRM91326.1 amino acid transport protein [Fructilactobacillus florum DSM 22689 = JCM 16035]